MVRREGTLRRQEAACLGGSKLFDHIDQTRT